LVYEERLGIDRAGTRAKLSVDKIATKMKADPKMVLKVAKRLGIRLSPRKASPR
jgi:hypothetical protein